MFFLIPLSFSVIWTNSAVERSIEILPMAIEFRFLIYLKTRSMRTEINWNPRWSLKPFIFIPSPSGNERNSIHFLLIRKRPALRKNSSKFYQRSVISSIFVSLVCRNESNPFLSFDFDFSQTMQLDNTALARWNLLKSNWRAMLRKSNSDSDFNLLVHLKKAPVCIR